MSSPEPEVSVLDQALSWGTDLLGLAEKQAASLAQAQARITELERHVSDLETTKRANTGAVLDSDKVEAALTHLQHVGFMTSESKQAATHRIRANPNEALSIIVGMANFIPPLLNPSGASTLSPQSGTASKTSWY